jgi:hypothetical protein
LAYLVVKKAALTYFYLKRGDVFMVKRDSLIKAFKEEVKRSNPMTFPICVDSFTNLWQYEFGTLDDLPPEVEKLIAYRAMELGLMDDDEI